MCKRVNINKFFFAPQPPQQHLSQGNLWPICSYKALLQYQPQLLMTVNPIGWSCNAHSGMHAFCNLIFVGAKFVTHE